MKLHFDPDALATTRYDCPSNRTLCGAKASRRNNSPVHVTSLVAAVTCARCKALLAERRNS